MQNYVTIYWQIGMKYEPSSDIKRYVKGSDHEFNITSKK